MLFVSACISLFAMERNDNGGYTSTLTVSHKVAQQETVKEIVKQSSNVPDAVKTFLLVFDQQLHDARKDFIAHNKALLDYFVLLLLEAFPAQSYLIARLLFSYNPLAVTIAQKKFGYKINPLLFKQSDKEQIRKARDFIERNDKQSLMSWLKRGFDPNVQIREGTLLTFALSLASRELVYQLVRFGADLYSIVDIPTYGFRGTPRQFLTFLIENITDTYKKIKLKEIDDDLSMLMARGDNKTKRE